MFQRYFRHFAVFLSYGFIVYRVPQKNIAEPDIQKREKMIAISVFPSFKFYGKQAPAS